MNFSDEWNKLLVRLRRDVFHMSHHFGGVITRDEEAWSKASDLLRIQSRIYLTGRSENLWQDAEDITQQALLKLQSEHVIRALVLSGSPAAYIPVILRNLWIDTLRRCKHEASFLEDVLLSEFPSTETRESPYHVDELRLVLRSLSSQDRELLKMRFWRDMNIAAIAKRLGISYSAASVRIFRLLKKLRSELDSNKKMQS